MSIVQVTFGYEPDEPDEASSTGMSEAEYVRIMDALAAMGASDVGFEVQP